MSSKLEQLTQETKEKFKVLKTIPDFGISESAKQELIPIIKNYWGGNCTFNNSTFVIETSPEHFAFMPNQYFYLATELYELATLLKQTFDIFDKYFRDEKSKLVINTLQDHIKRGQHEDVEKYIISEIETANDIFVQIGNEQKENFCYLIGNLEENKKFGNLEKNTFRGTADLYGAYLLNVAPLTTAESGEFGGLMYALASSPTIYSQLKNNIIKQEQKDSVQDFQFDNSNKKYEQIIYYGVPGSGKSYAIDKIVKNLESQPPISNVKYTRRVVFHPEYTNADFIGQILPETKNGGIHYNFIPGHFTKILKDAYRNPDKNFALVIEEINRGNAAAIFGDIFQLLDRLNETESDYSANDQFTYTCGWSKYGIDNSDIIYEIFKGKEGKFEPLFLKYGEQTLHINYNTAIRLPPNLSIYATMNTSDQNVFTLDNAFQRRWNMQLVKNECFDSSQMNSTITVNDKYITWKDFQEQINKVIGEKSNESGLSSMEDKRLGCWFVKAEKNTISKESFANKVLKYLWDDAFKFYHTEIFKEGIKNFEDLQKKFIDIGFDVFNDVCELKDKIHLIEGKTASDFQLEAE